MRGETVAKSMKCNVNDADDEDEDGSFANGVGCLRLPLSSLPKVLFDPARNLAKCFRNVADSVTFSAWARIILCRFG